MARVALRPLLREIRGCTECVQWLPAGPRPIVQAGTKARVAIIGQAPGRKVHETGIPWDDPSGDRLRNWLGVGRDTFYDPNALALVPMGFCYPGTTKGADLPPRPECAPLWHERLLSALPNIELYLLFGRYAQARYLGDKASKKLTDTVVNWRAFTPRMIPMPHPSPRNQRWLVRNPWFEDEVIPYTQRRLKRLGLR